MGTLLFGLSVFVWKRGLDLGSSLWFMYLLAIQGVLFGAGCVGTPTHTRSDFHFLFCPSRVFYIGTSSLNPKTTTHTNAQGGLPPPNDDGTANEMLGHQVTRLRQLISCKPKNTRAHTRWIFEYDFIPLKHTS
jgi:hypothetical protein